MTELQGKLLQLLTEIDEICQREQIQYYLCEETAYGAVAKNAFLSENCRANVAMTVKDMQKFMAAVEKAGRADRLVDSMLTNKTYPEFSLHYCDTETTMIKLPFRPVGALPCIGVTIHPIRFKGAPGVKFYRLTRKIQEYSVKTAAGRKFSQKAVVIACRVAYGILGSRWLFKRWCAGFAQTKGKAFAVGASKYVLPKAFLKQAQTAVLEGKEFAVFGNAEEYLNLRYHCQDFREKVPSYAKESPELLISCHIPYEQFLQQAPEMGVDFKAADQNYRKYEKLRQIVGNENKKISKYYAIVDRTQKRFEMYEKYMPIKKVLVQLYQQERYEELNALLKPYRSALRSCQKKGLGLCFDKEIFDMTMHILRLEGRNAYAQTLQMLVPKQHWEPMVVTDYKGQLVEITEYDQLPEDYLSNIEELQND
ncbi:MAG: hypothetical protein J6Q92_01895 [Oscillospiraceae bacterium]|nr:hypothetical protein [Oscillospiraceae bacterium]